MKSILRIFTAVAFACALLPTPTLAQSATFSPSVDVGNGEKGFAVVANTAATTVKFSAIISVTNTVVAAITFPERVTVGTARVAYTGDAALVGKTLFAGVRYPVYGDAITLTSGSVLLVRR